jgi:cell division initiation protein
MRISPLDIQQQVFRSAWRGFDRREVQTFLELVRGEMQDIVKENSELRNEITKLEALFAYFRGKETAPKKPMLTAQKLVEEIRGGAKKEAEVTISQAELQAERIINQAYQRLAKIIDEIGEMKRQRVQFMSSFSSVLDTHKKLLSVMEEEERDRSKHEEKPRVAAKEASGKA